MWPNYSGTELVGCLEGCAAPGSIPRAQRPPAMRAKRLWGRECSQLLLDQYISFCVPLSKPTPKIAKIYAPFLTSRQVAPKCSISIVKKYAERLILTAVKETKTQKTKYVKQKKCMKQKKLPDISVCQANLLQGLQK